MGDVENWNPLVIAAAVAAITFFVTKSGTWGISQFTERRTSREMIEAWNTWARPYFEPPKPGMPDDSIPSQLRDIRHQLYPNSGLSLADKVARLETKADAMSEAQARNGEEIRWTAGAIQALADAGDVKLPKREPSAS